MSFGAEVWARLTALPVLVVLPWQCNFQLTPPDGREPAPVGAKQEQAPVRVPVAPPPAPRPAKLVTLPEAVVLKAMDAGRPTFLRCWARAQRDDPTLSGSKVKLHIELDERGKVTAVTSDTESELLARCLAVVARGLPFPPAGQPALVELPLIFQ
jgi:hypothetical protein